MKQFSFKSVTRTAAMIGIKRIRQQLAVSICEDK